MNADRHGLNEISEKIIGCASQVHNASGCGFLEKVYENASALELKRDGLKIDQQVPIKVYHRDKVVGDYTVDILAEEEIIVESKAVKSIAKNHKV